MKSQANAIIGHTGFVGSNLIKYIDFEFKFNSKNINDIVNHKYDLLICSAPSATKWIINKNPDEDIENINKIFDLLKKTSFEKIILLSSIDVYGYETSKNLNENNYVDNKNNHNYGINRIYFENLITNTFEKSKVIRLPGLFGDGLKKNILFDIKNKNIKYLEENVNRNSSFQWYPIKNLYKDLIKVNKFNNQIINIATETIYNYEIEELINQKIFNSRSNIQNYNIKSLFFDSDLRKEEILIEIKGYLDI
jgi:nucleoside-diphosphate-sugar epimerase